MSREVWSGSAGTSNTPPLQPLLLQDMQPQMPLSLQTFTPTATFEPPFRQLHGNEGSAFAYMSGVLYDNMSARLKMQEVDCRAVELDREEAERRAAEFERETSRRREELDRVERRLIEDADRARHKAAAEQLNMIFRFSR